MSESIARRSPSGRADGRLRRPAAARPRAGLPHPRRPDVGAGVGRADPGPDRRRGRAGPGRGHRLARRQRPDDRRARPGDPDEPIGPHPAATLADRPPPPLPTSGRRILPAAVGPRPTRAISTRRRRRPPGGATRRRRPWPAWSARRRSATGPAVGRRPAHRPRRLRPAAAPTRSGMYLKEIGKVPLLTGRRGGHPGPLRRGRAARAAARLARAGRGRRRPTPSGQRRRPAAGARGAGGQAHPRRGQPAPGGVDRQAVPQPGHGVPRPHPGGQPRPDAGGRQVRLHQGLQVLDLRHVVDPPGHHPGHRRPGPHHPHPGAHGRDHQQGGAGPAPAAPGPRPRADRRGGGRPDRDDRRPGCGRSCGSARRRCPSSSRWATTTSACPT